MHRWGLTILFIIASIAGGAMSHAAEIIVLASQGNLPGVTPDLALLTGRVLPFDWQKQNRQTL
jgi:hypothetical protein